MQTLEKYDIQKIYATYDIWPQIAKKSFETDHGSIDFGKVHHIVFSGMGGSGAIGDMFSAILSKTKIHVDVVKGYLLPQTVDSNTVVVALSVSGNTVETLSILDAARKIGCKIIAFSSGGKMQEYCVKYNIEHRFVPKVHSPRGSFTSYLYAILQVSYKTFEINKNDIIESIIELEKINKKINTTNLTESNPSLELARWISDYPIIYYPWGLQSAAIRFKNSLQENAKMHAATEDVIEFCHNGIVAWEKPSNNQPILLQGVDDHIKTKERSKVIEEFFVQNKIEYKKITSVSGSILTKIINLIYLLDFSTIYKSVLMGIDPSPVKSIDSIKKKI
jgi:glucose/mannose-6-phosphate isomerase